MALTEPHAPQPPGADGDAEIVRLIEGRQGNGLVLLLERHGGRVQAGLRRTFEGVLMDAEIEEAMSTASYLAWSRIEQFEPSRGTLRAWFFVIARNAANGILRSRSRRGFEPRSDEIERLPTEADDRDEPREPTVLLQTLHECVAELPRLQRRIIEADLRSGDVAEAAALAEELGTSKGSIYVSRNNARKKLRKLLEQRGIQLGDEVQT